MVQQDLETKGSQKNSSFPLASPYEQGLTRKSCKGVKHMAQVHVFFAKNMKKMYHIY